MKTVILLALSGFILTGCGKISRIEASYTGYSIECIDGVSYIQFTSGASVQYTPDGKVKTCSSK